MPDSKTCLRSKLVWRCRRGTKELDWVLRNFLERHFDQLSPHHQGGFALLLEQQDPLLIDWIWGGLSTPDETAAAEVVAMIRQHAGFRSELV